MWSRGEGKLLGRERGREKKARHSKGDAPLKRQVKANIRGDMSHSKWFDSVPHRARVGVSFAFDVSPRRRRREVSGGGNRNKERLVETSDSRRVRGELIHCIQCVWSLKVSPTWRGGRLERSSDATNLGNGHRSKQWPTSNGNKQYAEFSRFSPVNKLDGLNDHVKGCQRLVDHRRSHDRRHTK